VPIDIASYRRWEGRARPTPFAALAIASTMIRRRMRIRLVKVIVFGFTLIASGFALLLFYGILRGHAEPALRNQIRQFGLENVNVLAYLNRLFDMQVGFWAVLLSALVAAPLIAEDRRARALPLYFSRPIGHIEYVIGKAASAAFFLALLLVVPRLAMYGMEIAFSDAKGVALRQLPTLLGGCACAGLTIVLLTSLSLGVSSLTERPTYAALFLLGLASVVTGVAHILAEAALNDPAWLALSPFTCLHRIGLDLVPFSSPIADEMTASIEALPLRNAWLGFGAWTAVSLGTLFVRVRRVEVVT
jgi:ABC-type transport system involved in multi-copper enzyme maturation permease subunit